MANKKCSTRGFSVGCVEKYGDLTVLKAHGALCVRGFDKNGQHVNTCRRTAALARKVAIKAARSGLQDHYGQLDGAKKRRSPKPPWQRGEVIAATVEKSRRRFVNELLDAGATYDPRKGWVQDGAYLSKDPKEALRFLRGGG